MQGYNLCWCVGNGQYLLEVEQIKTRIRETEKPLLLVVFPVPWWIGSNSESIIGMTKQQATWSPYDFNGGTCVGIAGADYCVVAADTRMSTGYSILTLDYSKICKLAEKSLIASSGFQADVRASQKQLAARHLERAVSTYDAVGSYERVGYSSQGSSAKLIMPFLDNQLKSPSPLLLPAKDAVTPLSEVEAVDLVKTAFASATERDICTAWSSVRRTSSDVFALK